MIKRISLALLLLGIALPAWADGTINTLTAGGALTGSELIPMYQSVNPMVTTTPAAIGTYLGGTFLSKANNLSDLASAGTARTNLGLGALATLSSVNLATQATGNLPVGNLNSGTGASSTTYWRGDGTWATPAGAGTVTSVAMTVPAWLTVGGSPITGAGTLAITGTSEAANLFLASPNGSSGALSPRAIAVADFEPTLGAAVSTLCSASTTNFVRGDGTCVAPSGGTTTITAAPGLGNSLTSFNGTGAAQTVTNASTLYPQAGTYTVSAAYSLNATTGTTPCTTSVLCDLARTILANGSASIAITAPNPAGTLGAYQIADVAGHGFTVPTIGGTATFFGCVTGSPTTLTVPANYGVQLFDQGSSANTYLCTFQPLTQVSGGVTGPTIGQLMISPGTTGAATGIAETDGQFAVGASGSWGKRALVALDIPGALVNALTDGTTITVPALTGAGALDTVTLGGSHAFANPASMSGTQAQGLTFDVLENGTGGYTPTWGSEYIFASGTPIFNTAANALNIVSCVTVPSLTQLHCVGPTAPPPAISLSWAPGQNLAAATNGIGIHTASIARTITGVVCRPDTAVGGTATIDVWIAASTTPLSSGTKVTTTSCNANGTAATNQTGLASSSVSVPAGDTIGIVATGAGWSGPSAGAGSISVNVQ